MKFARGLVRIVKGILREISDQNAYERHLRSRGSVHSAEEWRHFWDARMARKFRRSKCC